MLIRKLKRDFDEVPSDVFDRKQPWAVVDTKEITGPFSATNSASLFGTQTKQMMSSPLALKLTQCG
jgi:hypothetical protein